MLGLCKDNEEVKDKIQLYQDAGFPIENIKVHPHNGGDYEEYGYIHLGIPQGSYGYQKKRVAQYYRRLW